MLFVFGGLCAFAGFSEGSLLLLPLLGSQEKLSFSCQDGSEPKDELVVHVGTDNVSHEQLGGRDLALAGAAEDSVSFFQNPGVLLVMLPFLDDGLDNDYQNSKSGSNAADC